MKTKQIIVVRRDLKMRRGKEVAQGAHAAMAWLTSRLNRVDDSLVDGTELFEVALTPAEITWVKGIFTKITVQVDDEAALDAVYEAAKAAGLEARMIVDSGLTEFHGVPTKTCCAIGPDEIEKIDAVTGHLKPY